MWGTPYYVAPEKLDHQPEDFRSDLYSLGGTLFHAIAGRPPFEAETASMVALKHLKSQSVSLQAFAPDVSSATAYVINRMLHKDPDQRYQSYAELIEHMEYAKAQLAGAAGGPRKPKERVVVAGGAQQQKAQGFMTLVHAAGAAGRGLRGYQYRDRIFGRHDTVQDLPDGAADRRATRSRNGSRPRGKQVLAGDYATAQEAPEKAGRIGPRPAAAELGHAARGAHRAPAGKCRRMRGTGSRWSTSAAIFPMIWRMRPSWISSRRRAGKLAGAGGHSRQGRACAPRMAWRRLSALLFGLKDWALGKFEDADGVVENVPGFRAQGALSHGSATTSRWRNGMSDQFAAYAAAAAAAAAADTPAKRARAL